jgi:hypothetical protein
VVASDSFSRTASGDWQTADIGSLYSYQGKLADLGVAAGSGVMNLPNAGASRSAFLLSTLAADVDVSFTTWLEKTPTGDVWVYSTVRRATDGSAYRPKIRISGGAVYVQVSRVTSSGESPLGPAVLVTGLTATPNVPIHVHAQATGSTPTTLVIRAWADGQPEPQTWQFSATDSTPALQVAGSVGLIAYANTNVTNAPLAVHFDDLLVTTTDPPRLVGEQLVGAGDISTCSGKGDEATARLLGFLPGTVFTVGDNAYPEGSAADFANCYDPSWGAQKSRTWPTIGNHEYNTADAQPYFDYFGAAAGDPGKGYYAYDIGAWRVYVLNSNCGVVSCAAGSAQEVWFKTDLGLRNPQCSIAVWHHPRYSSGSEHGSSASVQPLWQDAYDAGVELVLSGHDHDYERFAPLDATGALDPSMGVREFVVGTGGAGLLTMNAALPNSEVRQSASWGVIRLVLGSGAFEWEFIPVAGSVFSDRGSGTCHAPTAPPSPPSAAGTLITGQLWLPLAWLRIRRTLRLRRRPGG